MKRRTTFVVTVALGVAALGVYELKYRVAELESEAVRLAGELIKERQAVHVLSTDWTYLNRPENLALLAEEYLDLVPLDGDRIVAASELPKRVKPAAELAQAETTSPGEAAR